MLQKEIMERIIYDDTMQRDVMSVEPVTIYDKNKDSVKNEERFFLSEKRIFRKSIATIINLRDFFTL